MDYHPIQGRVERLLVAYVTETGIRFWTDGPFSLYSELSHYKVKHGIYVCLMSLIMNCFIVQIGTVVEGSADFYTSRIPKRQRKINLIDELLSDAEFRRYSKC